MQRKCEGLINVTGSGGTLRMNDPSLCHNSRPMASRRIPQVVYGVHLSSEIFVLIYRMQCVIGPGFCLRLQKGQFGYGLGFCMRRIGTSREVRISDSRSWRHGVSERLHPGVQNLNCSAPHARGSTLKYGRKQRAPCICPRGTLFAWKRCTLTRLRSKLCTVVFAHISVYSWQGPAGAKNVSDIRQIYAATLLAQQQR